MVILSYFMELYECYSVSIIIFILSLILENCQVLSNGQRGRVGQNIYFNARGLHSIFEGNQQIFALLGGVWFIVLVQWPIHDRSMKLVNHYYLNE